MAVKDVFGADDLERSGEVTLKVLMDFAEGRGLKIMKEEVETLAAMAKKTTHRDRNGAVSGNSSSASLSSGSKEHLSHSALAFSSDNSKIQKKSESIKRSIKNIKKGEKLYC